MGWCRGVHLSLQIGHRLFRGKKKKVTVAAMTEPGETVVIKAVAAGVKYGPAGSPMGMRAGGVALLRKSKYLHFSRASGLHAHCSGEGTHYWGTPLWEQQHFLLSLYYHCPDRIYSNHPKRR